MKKIIFLAIITFVLTGILALALPTTTAHGLSDLMDSVGNEDDTVTVGEASDTVEEKEGQYLRDVIRWIPVVGAVLFVVGILVGVLAVKSNEVRKWGIRMAAIESIVAFTVYLIACIAYDKYYHVDGVVNPASPYYVERYSEMMQNVRGISAVYATARNQGDGVIVSFLRLFSYFFKNAVAPLVLICVGGGLIVCLMAQGKKNVQRWAVVGLCIVAPMAILIGAHYIA